MRSKRGYGGGGFTSRSRSADPEVTSLAVARMPLPAEIENVWG